MDWLYAIADEDPINLFVMGFTLVWLAVLFRLDAGKQLRELRRRIVSCPIHHAWATILGPAGAVDSCSLLEADARLSCDRRCVRPARRRNVARSASPARPVVVSAREAFEARSRPPRR